MANQINAISYSNTFGEWVVATNALIQNQNEILANNYIKPTGTLYLNSPTLGLQVGNNAVISGIFSVQGVNSSTYLQNQVTSDGMILARGGIYANSNTTFANTMSILGTLNISGNTFSTSNTRISGVNKLYVDSNTTFSNTLFLTSTADNIIASGSITSNYANTNNLKSLNSVLVGTTTVTGNETISGTLDVTGATTVTTLTASGLTTLNSTQINGPTTIYGSSVISGTTSSTSNTRISGVNKLYVDSNTTFSNTLFLTSTADNIIASGSITSNYANTNNLKSLNSVLVGTTTVTGNETISGTLGVTGATTVTALTASGLTTLNSDTNITGTTSLTGRLALNGLYMGAAGAAIASAATMDLTVVTGNIVRVTGAATTSAFIMNPGQQLELVAPASWTLIFNSLNMNITGGTNYICASEDRIFVTKDSSNTIHVNIIRQNGTPVRDRQGSVVQYVSMPVYRVAWGITIPAYGQTYPTPLDMTITPRAAGNSILINWNIFTEGNFDIIFHIRRNGVFLPNIWDGNYWSGLVVMPYDVSADSTPVNVTVSYTDTACLGTPSTYSLWAMSSYAAEVLYLNRTASSAGQPGYETGGCTGYLMEFQA